MISSMIIKNPFNQIALEGLIQSKIINIVPGFKFTGKDGKTKVFPENLHIIITQPPLSEKLYTSKENQWVISLDELICNPYQKFTHDSLEYIEFRKKETDRVLPFGKKKDVGWEDADSIIWDLICASEDHPEMDFIAYGIEVFRYLPVVFISIPIKIDQMSLFRAIKSDYVLLEAIKNWFYLNSVASDKFRSSLTFKEFINLSRLKDFHGNLYHVSRDGALSHLTPKVSERIMNHENMGIRRISVSTSISNCIKGMMPSVDSDGENLFVYKVVGPSSARIMCPSTNLLPDVSKTKEMWILDKVAVEKIKTIRVSSMKDNGKITSYNVETVFDNETYRNIERIKI